VEFVFSQEQFLPAAIDKLHDDAFVVPDTFYRGENIEDAIGFQGWQRSGQISSVYSKGKLT